MENKIFQYIDSQARNHIYKHKDICIKIAKTSNNIPKRIRIFRDSNKLIELTPYKDNRYMHKAVYYIYGAIFTKEYIFLYRAPRVKKGRKYPVIRNNSVVYLEHMYLSQVEKDRVRLQAMAGGIIRKPRSKPSIEESIFWEQILGENVGSKA